MMNDRIDRVHLVLSRQDPDRQSECTGPQREHLRLEQFGDPGGLIEALKFHPPATVDLYPLWPFYPLA